VSLLVVKMTEFLTSWLALSWLFWLYPCREPNPWVLDLEWEADYAHHELEIQARVTALGSSEDQLRAMERFIQGYASAIGGGAMSGVNREELPWSRRIYMANRDLDSFCAWSGTPLPGWSDFL
jgi:hypothetical protein